MNSTTIACPDIERLRILDHIPLGVLILASDYRATFWNKCLAYWTGLEEAKVTGRDIREQYPQFAEKRFASRIESVFRGGPPIIFSSHIHKYLIPAKLPDGSHRLQHVTVSPMREQDGRFLAMFMIQDVTEVSTRLIQRKKAEDELRLVLAQLEATNAKLEESNAQAARMARQAQEANAAKSIFLANMSHEIRTPMSGILGALDMLASEEDDPDKLTLLQMTTASAKSLLHIINDILDLSKVEAGKLELRPEDVSLEAIMQRCLHLYSFPAKNKNLDLHLELGADVPRTLRVDPTRLEQVLRNLLDNAVKFTAQGRITFGVERVDDPDLGPALRFLVRDTGIGIASTTLKRLFQPFSQADSSYAKTYGGTGLGLALSRRMVERMGGTMEVQSTPDQGSTFSFTLPLHGPAGRPVSQSCAPEGSMPASCLPQASPQTHQPGSVAGPSASSLPSDDSAPPRTFRVLVAEDVDLNRQYLAFLLKQQGYLLDMASSGQEAVQAFQSQTYDIILMDIQMPIMDGLEATARIRALEREQGLRHTPIIALTAYAMPEEQETFMNSGMDGFVAKPVLGDKLQAEIQRVLAAHASSPREPGSTAHPPTDTATAAASPSQKKPASSQEAAGALPPAFNLQDVKTRFLGNDALWRKIALRFSQEEMPEYLNQIQNLLEVPDLQETARIGHKMKGALGTLCADPAREAALKVEMAAKSGNIRETEDGLRALLLELQRLYDFPGLDAPEADPES